MAYTKGIPGGGGFGKGGKGSGGGGKKSWTSDQDYKDLVKGVAFGAVGTYEATTEGITKKLEELEKGVFPSEERDRNKNKNLNVFEAKKKKDEEKKKKKDEEKKKKKK
jgi:hypothetical protein